MRYSVKHAIPGRIRLYIAGLGFEAAISEAVQAWLRSQSWVRDVRVNMGCDSLAVAYDPAAEEQIQGLLAFLGGATRKELLALVAMVEPVQAKPIRSAAETPKRQEYPMVLPSLSLGLAFFANPAAVAVNTPLILWNAAPIFRRAWMIWSTEKRLNVDFLDALAISASLLQGMTMTGAIITWLVRLGDWIRDLTAAGSKKAIGQLLEFQDKNAWLVRDGAVVSVPASQLAEGDVIVVYHGEMIPVDGEVIEGRATVDQKTITGESLPVVRSKGDTAFAATIVQDGQIRIRALRVGIGTTAGQIATLVESAPIGDTRMQNHAERLADRLVLPTLSLAVGAALATADFNRFLSLVIIDYGTGIRVAAPTSVLSSMTYAARSGIVVKSGRHMERLAEIDTVLFDKTGTLTRGVPAVRDVVTYSNAMPPDHLLSLAVAAETHLKHPVADAIRIRARELNLQIPDCDEAQYHVGLGVEGQVNGNYVHVGSERFMRRSDIAVDPAAGDRAAFDERGESCMYVAVDGKLAGLIAYADQIRPESPEIIRTLHAMGIRNTIMLTGDNTAVANAVCRRLGLSGHRANMLPADKAEAVQELQREGRVVAMIGDGINDSPALSFADVGIAMKHGADITHESADIVLMEDSLWKLVKVIEVSRGAVGLIKQNYAIVTGLNTLALALALPGGLVSPELTAVISNGSAILASMNGVRPLLYQP
jgi:Cu2+-exporting ATPase